MTTASNNAKNGSNFRSNPRKYPYISIVITINIVIRLMFLIIVRPVSYCLNNSVSIIICVLYHYKQIAK